mmetsp:Transcript_26837/g.63058  ORF Transcript_26837/g.63058 Transcript_26837/m.63058 type:complete len:284 (+) Transcript_26837:58-909(+)
MAYTSFAKWYGSQLKAKPFLVNVSSGVLLMTIGDVLAQRIEVRAINRKRKESRQQQSTNDTKDPESLTISAPILMFLEATDATYQALREEVTSFGWDKPRTAKMAAWSLLFVPIYVKIFKMYDRYLPKKNLPSIAARVGCSFLSSIPLNFAFYTYGTAVEHTAEWYEKRQQQLCLRLEMQQKNKQNLQADRSPVVFSETTTLEVPYRFDELVEKTQRKLDAEFVKTVKASAAFWVPTNFLSFSIIPSHIQPMNLMFWSVFWNCYLSISQHREIVLDDVHTTEK